MEYLDYYDENDNYMGFETRDNVHKNALWHKTVHCWLYTHDGKVIFQIRKDEEKLYTTASGHVAHKETVNEAFIREIHEEIGLLLNKNHAKLIDIVPWKMDFKKKDGFIMKDRAKANIFIYEYQGDYQDFHFDPEEVLGIAIVDAKEALELFEEKRDIIEATIVTNGAHQNKVTKKNLDKDSFLLINDETLMRKYGNIVKCIIKETKNN